MRFLRQTAIILALLPAMTAVNAAAQGDDLSGIFVRNSNELADTTTGPHGGKIIERGPFACETVMDPDGVSVYIFDSTGNSVDLEGVTGTCLMVRGLRDSDRVDLRVKKDSRKKYPRLGDTETSRTRHLYAPYDFSLVADGASRVRVDLAGLPASDTLEITYATAYVMTRLRGWACRGHDSRIFLEYKNYPLCDKEYLDEAPYLFQCPNHENSRDHQPSKCPLCGAERIPTRQSPTADPSQFGAPSREVR